MFSLKFHIRFFVVATILFLINVFTNVFLVTGQWFFEKHALIFTIFSIFSTSFFITYLYQIISENRHRFPFRLLGGHEVTGSSKQEKRYRNFAEAEIHGNEAERLRIARELHDDTIHRLIAIGQRIELIKFDHPSPQLAAPMEELIKVTNDGIDHLRSVIKELRPSHLTKMGLVQAIGGLLDDKKEELFYSVEFTVLGEEYRLNDSTELMIYRLAQTALQNIKLHSKCLEASLNLRFEEEELMLVVEDNGVGFDVPAEEHLFEHAHFGLLGMKERAELCNGKFMIHSIKGSGTCVTIEIPKKGNIS